MTPSGINPLDGADFPEMEELRDGPMDVEIMRMAIEALNGQGHPDITRETLAHNREHRLLVAELLRDCRPIPVILDMIRTLER